MEWLNQIDTQLLLLLNSNKNTFWDMTMLLITRKETWLSLYLTILIMLGVKYKRNALIIIPMLILTITLNDQIAGFIKHGVERYRPYRDPNISHLVNTVLNSGGTYGFLSAHAANAFGFAVFTSKLFKNSIYSIFFIIWAALIAYSRVYLGVHYPGDIICGAIMGSLIGWGMYKLTYFLENRFITRYRMLYSKRLSNRDATLLILVAVIILFTIVTSVTKLMQYGFL